MTDPLTVTPMLIERPFGESGAEICPSPTPHLQGDFTAAETPPMNGTAPYGIGEEGAISVKQLWQSHAQAVSL